MLGQGQGILGLFGQQQVDLAQAMQAFTQHQTQLQLQGDAAVRDLDLQCMAECAQQFAAANGVGQVVVTAVLAVEQHQGAAVIECLHFAFIQRGGLVEAVAVAFQQFSQARARQATQLFLRAQLYGQDCTGLWWACHCLLGWAGDIGVIMQVGERLVVLVLVLVHDSSDGRACNGRGFVKAWIAQIANFKCRFVRLVFQRVVILCFWLYLTRRRREAGMQLARQVANLVLALSGRGEFIQVTQPYAQLQQRRGDETPQTKA